jgi:hypothetical protein
MAEKKDISLMTLRRAKDELHVEYEYEGSGNGSDHVLAPAR